MSPLPMRTARRRAFRAAATMVAVVAALVATACSDRIAGPERDASAAAGRRRPDGGAATPPSAGTPVPQQGQGNPLGGASFHVEPGSRAAEQARAWRASRPADAAQMDRIAAQPQAHWFGDWTPSPRAEVEELVRAAAVAGRVPVLVAYDIPQRDCGGYSANAQSAAGYRRWIDDFAAGLGGGAAKAVVVLEPDALPDLDCLSAADQATRLELLRYAIRALAARPGVLTYVDAGNAEWHPAATMAARLRLLGTEGLAGFALNVSNFFTTSASAAYGDLIGNALGGLHYIVDTSRNGLGPTADRQWCNPAGRALGERPTAATGRPLADAYLWVKAPGESDGSCGGAPAAGEWMAGYALGLAQRASW